MTNKEQILEEFNKIFCYERDVEQIEVYPGEVEAFISKALTQTQQATIERIEKELPWKIHNIGEWGKGWNLYRDRVEQVLDKLKKEKPTIFPKTYKGEKIEIKDVK